MATNRRKKRDHMRYVINVQSRKTDAVDPRPEPTGDRVKDLGTIKAQLIGKLGARGYGRLLGELREQAAE